MTNVIALAKQAGFHITHDPFTGGHWLAQHDAECFERFATLVRNAAMEECKKTILEHSHSPETQRFSDARMSFYAAIESLKEPTP